jgi:hypothetical protein
VAFVPVLRDPVRRLKWANGLGSLALGATGNASEWGARGAVLAAATALLVMLPSPVFATAPAAAHRVLIGYPGGDDWEPSIASDLDGDVYVVWAHFGGVPGCSRCGTPAAMLELSRDGGQTFGAPRPLFPDSRAQVDLNVRVNSTGAVFVSYLFGLATVLQRSLDEGRTWSVPLALNHGLTGSTDKPGLVVHGSHVYVAFDIQGRPVMTASSDGGVTFQRVLLDPRPLRLGFSLNSGGTVSSNGTVYYAWNGVRGHGTLTPQTNYLTRSTDGGVHWTFLPVNRGLPSGPACPQSCGWDYLGPQMVAAVDRGGALELLFNAGTVNNGSPSIWFQRSTDMGQTFSAPRVVSTDGSSAWHVFPAMDAGARGEVFIAWMDNHTGNYNVWYRSSLDGGRSWSPEVRVSSLQGHFSYLNATGFTFPYGDYFILNANPNDVVHLAWGEGPNWTGPGNVFYARLPIQD